MDLETLLLDLITERGISYRTAQQYEMALRMYGRHLGHNPTVNDLSPEAVNRWLAELAATKAPRTVLSKKRSLTAIWNFAAERGLAPYYHARRLRRVRVPDANFEVWSTDYVRRLLDAAESITGRMGGSHRIAANAGMRALILVGFETGLRVGDLLTLRFSEVNFDGGKIRITQNKTGRAHCAYISAHAVAAIRAIEQPARDQVWPIRYPSLRAWVDRLFEAAGIERQKGQGLGQLRKCHGTEAARTHGLEAAARSLGHISGTQVAARHYVSRDVVPSGIMVPILSEADDGRGRGNEAGTRTLRGDSASGDQEPSGRADDQPADTPAQRDHGGELL